VQPGYVFLPSLNHPGQRVIIRGGPFLQGTNKSNAGLLIGMEFIPASLNCSAEEVAALNQFARDAKSGEGLPGLLFTGEVGFQNNRIEGRLLAMAGRIRSVGLKSRVLLVADLGHLLAANDMDALLDPECFFLPDLQMWVSTLGSESELNRRLSFVLEERLRMRLPTVVFVQDVHSFERSRSLFATAYREVNISKCMPPAHSPPTKAGHGQPVDEPSRSPAKVVARWIELRREND
jgi:hypothetical protein